MYYKSIILFLNGLFYFVEDDLFPLTVCCDLDMNCVMLVQLTCLFVQLLSNDVIILIMNKLR